MNFNETIPFLFAQFSTYLKVEIEKQLNKHQLHGGQIFILFTLWKTDGLSQTELSEKLRVSSPTIYKMVKSLEKNGFVVCSSCPKDKRTVRVFATPKGVAIRPKIEEEWIKIGEKLLFNLTSTEQLLLYQLFNKIGENLIIQNEPQV